METTGATDFRAQMKEWLDVAEKNPVKVNRPNGKSVVIIDTNAFEEMVMELAELRGVNKGLLAAAEGRTVAGNKNVLRQALDDVKQDSRNKRKKKVAG